MQKRILSLLVDNTAGVLSRIAGLFSRRGYNIDSLTVGVTADERYSRMTVVCSGDSMILEQITKQLAKLVDHLISCIAVTAHRNGDTAEFGRFGLTDR